MHRLDEAELTSLLDRLDYRAPAMDTVWQPNARRRSGRFRFGVLVPVALAVVLTAATGVVAAANGWFEQFVPSGDCIANDPACGADFAQVGLLVDQTTNVTAVNVLVKRGLSDERVAEIAKSVAAEQGAGRAIVYVLDDLPPGPMSAGFSTMPIDDAPAPSPPSELAPYLRLTYDAGPSGAHAIWP